MAIGTERLTVLRQRGREGEHTYGFYLYARGRGFSPGISCLAGTESACPPCPMGGGRGRIYAAPEQPCKHGLAQTAVRRGLGGPALAQRVWWPRCYADGASGFYRREHAPGSATRGERHGNQHGGTDAHALRHCRAVHTVSPSNPQCRRDLVSGLLRARLWERPG